MKTGMKQQTIEQLQAKNAQLVEALNAAHHALTALHGLTAYDSATLASCKLQEHFTIDETSTIMKITLALATGADKWLIKRDAEKDERIAALEAAMNPQDIADVDAALAGKGVSHE